MMSYENGPLIYVVGRFNCGKSMLLNAMLGRDLLPVRATLIWHPSYLIRYSPTEQFVLHQSDGKKLHVSREELFYYADEERDRGLSGSARLIEILTPSTMLCNGVEFVEAHFTNEYQAPLLKSFLDRSSAVLFLLDATCSVSEEDMYILKNISLQSKDNRKPIFFAINKWDLFEQLELTTAGRTQWEQRFRATLAEYTNSVGTDGYSERVFRVDALGAFRARMSSAPDCNVLEKSNVPMLERALQQFLRDIDERNLA